MKMAVSDFDVRQDVTEPNSEVLDIEIDDSEAYIDDIDVRVCLNANSSGNEKSIGNGIRNIDSKQKSSQITIHEKCVCNLSRLQDPGTCNFQRAGLKLIDDGENSLENDVGVVFTLDEGDDDNKEDDEEVEEIMKSSEMLDSIQNEIKRKVQDRIYEKRRMYRKRSKSVDHGRLKTSVFDFSKYGISVGVVNSTNDLLPGIEEFLCSVLARETLSPYAEEQRQYFLERLDIIKMPPSIPPRPQSLGVNLFPVGSSLSLSNHNSIPSAEQEDFAAYQRELSRALVETEVSPEPWRNKLNTLKGASIRKRVNERNSLTITESANDTTKSTQEEEDSMYEIPQLKRSLSESGYEKALDLSLVSKAASSENLLSREEPPPLPPRKDRTFSDATIRSSVGSMLDETTQDLVHRNTPTHHEQFDSRSERSTDDMLDDNTDEPIGASCDSIDDVELVDPETEMLKKLGVQLPQPKLKKRRSTRRKLGLSLSALKESNTSFRALEDIVLSGELHYRSKLSWTKKLVALTNGRLICYKADKPDSRPSQIVVLTGYHASYHKRDKRGYDIDLQHDHFESYTFLSDFKEWAEIWCRHINEASEGRKAAGPVLHLARGCTLGGSEGDYTLGKSNLDSSSSNLSLASSDGFDFDPGTVKVKKRDSSGTRTARMGSFAYRATQFFESLGKKSLRKSSSMDVYRQHTLSASQTSLSESLSPVTPESGIAEEPPTHITKHIKHQGYLDIYSSFNKRKWGKRWCMVHENNFECYRTQTSEVCELEFLLQNCILRRAIEETKSELGLMLIENQKEKITIEPLNWTELGSWLRVLMQETSTPTVPDGLQGYMDESNPYHEAVEITRLSDPFPASPPILSPGLNEHTLVSTNSDDEDNRRSTPSRNRDSGNCSAESMFGSLERKSNETRTHICYTDSSLPRVSIDGSGAIYTQVRKPSLPRENQSTYRSKNRTIIKETDTGANKLDYDFSSTVPSMKPGESLMDEIMSQFKTKISDTFDTAQEGNVFTFENVNNIMDENKCRKSLDPKEKLCEIENVVSPIKDNTVDVIVASTDNVLCSSFLDDSNTTKSVDVDSKDTSAFGDNSDPKLESNEMGAVEDRANCDTQAAQANGANTQENDLSLRPHTKDHPERVLRKNSSIAYDAETLQRNLEQLRTTLVQLKKDRICIRDRKQKITSEIDREYLEAEFNRLNRECSKVQEEINYTEKLHETLIGTKANQLADAAIENVEEFESNKEKKSATTENTEKELCVSDGSTCEIDFKSDVKNLEKQKLEGQTKGEPTQNIDCAENTDTELKCETLKKQIKELRPDNVVRTEGTDDICDKSGMEIDVLEYVNVDKNPKDMNEDGYDEIKEIVDEKKAKDLNTSVTESMNNAADLNRKENGKSELDTCKDKSLNNVALPGANKCDENSKDAVVEDCKTNDDLSSNDEMGELLSAFETKLTIHSSESE